MLKKILLKKCCTHLVKVSNRHQYKEKVIVSNQQNGPPHPGMRCRHTSRLLHTRFIINEQVMVMAPFWTLLPSWLSINIFQVLFELGLRMFICGFMTL